MKQKKEKSKFDALIDRITVSAIGFLVFIGLCAFVLIMIFGNWYTIPSIQGDKRFVCYRAIDEAIREKKFGDTLPPETELRTNCISAHLMSVSDLRNATNQGTLSSDFLLALKDPNCLGWAHFTISRMCNESMDGRRRACDLYDHPSIRELGDEFVAEMEKKHGIHWSNKRIKTIAERLELYTTRTCYTKPLRIGVLNDSGPSVNGVSLPNGVILLTAATLFQNDSEIAFILGHEIAHIDYASFDGAMLSHIKKNTNLSQRILDKKDLLFSKCRGPMDELFVDEISIRMVEAAGFDPSGALTVIEGFKQSDSSPNNTYRLQDSHPPNDMRLRIAAKNVLQTIHHRHWKQFVYYRGQRGFWIEPWDGSLPEETHIAPCTLQSTDCGDPNQRPKTPTNDYVWSSYVCTDKTSSIYPQSCIDGEKYRHALGYGCPGKELCCATYKLSGSIDTPDIESRQTACGDPDFLPMGWSAEHQSHWSTYACMNSHESPWPKYCLNKSSYSPTVPKTGCEDNQLCCPTQSTNIVK